MIKDYEIPLPRWELSDAFGRNALRSMRYELKKALCERDAARVELEETLKCQGRAVDRISMSLTEAQTTAKELDRRLQISEDARKNLGEKLRASRAEIDKHVAERARMRIEIERMKEKLDTLEKEHDVLTAEHEKLVRGLTDKEAAEV